MKRLLLPFSWIYQVITRFRNHLYDSGIRHSFQFDDLMTIGVGNLSMGGTGKTPVTEYLIKLLKNIYKTATLSRGYGRNTNGLRFLNSSDTALTAGDEPVQLYRKFGKEIDVLVCEDRILAIPTIMNQESPAQVVILDDSFQHRKVKPDLNILLTKFDSPFFLDRIFPAGWLRESRIGAGRADVLLVTKCPESISSAEKDSFLTQCSRYLRNAPVFFTRYKYHNPVSFGNMKTLPNKIILVTGIAHSDFLLNYCKERFLVLNHFRFSDHHLYSHAEIQAIIEKVKEPEVGILTTEKDMVRLSVFREDSIIKNQPWFYLPIELQFLSGGIDFDKMIIEKVQAKLKAGNCENEV